MLSQSHLVVCTRCGAEYDPYYYDECPRCEDYEIYEDEEDHFAVGGFEDEA